MKTTSPNHSAWLVPTGLVLLSAVPAIAGAARLTDLGHAHITANNARFMASRWPIAMHVVSVIPFSVMGAFQMSSEFRRKHRNWHRNAGRVLVLLGLMAAFSGLWMTLTYPWANNDGLGVYIERLVFGCAMFASMLLGVDAIRRRDFQAHGQWMMRAYAIGLGAGTQVLTHMPYFILVGKPGELGRTVMMGAGWAINVAVAEWVIRHQTGSRKVVRPAAAHRLLMERV